MTNEQWYVIFGEDWGRHSSTGQFLAKEIAKTRNVLWINSLGMRTPSFNLSDLTRIVTKLSRFITDSVSKKNAHATEENNIRVITPIAIPLLKYRMIRRFNQLFVSAFVKSKMRQFGVVNPIVMSAGPEAVDVIDRLNGKTTVYYCADKYAEFPGQDRELVLLLEREMLKKVDVVVVTSVALMADLEKLHKNVHYIPHGVDYALFHKALDDETTDPVHEHESYRRPLIGFVGLIGPHLNYEIIETLSTEFKDASILMIGPIEENANPPRRDNIFYLGKKERHQLPGYLRMFDVCITPYVDSERVRYANPTKVREYLAAGCPAICTPQDEARAISKQIYFAANGIGFANAVKQILASQIDRHAISASVSHQTWLDRASQLMQLVEGGVKC